MEHSQKSFITSDKQLSRSLLIHEKQIMDEIVLLHRSTGNYYSLNQTGTAIWRYCSENRRLDEIIDFVSHEYQIEKNTLGEEIGSYLQELIQEGILEVH